jgi:hypothetical protein
MNNERKDRQNEGIEAFFLGRDVSCLADCPMDAGFLQVGLRSVVKKAGQAPCLPR